MEFNAKSNKQLIHTLQSDVDELRQASGLDMDEFPTPSSTKAVSSAGIYTALQEQSNTLQEEIDTKQDKINSNTNLNLNEILIGDTIIRDYGLTTRSGDLNLHAMSGRINLFGHNIFYDLDSAGHNRNLIEHIDSKQDILDETTTLKIHRLEFGSFHAVNIQYQTISANKIYFNTDELYYKKTTGGNYFNLQNTLDTFQTGLEQKQDTIQDNDLTISKTSGLQSALDTFQTGLEQKQDTIHDSGLTISKTSGLQSALDGKASVSSLLPKQNVLTAGENITIVDNVISSSSGGTISSSGPIYQAGNNIDISEDHSISLAPNINCTSVTTGLVSATGIAVSPDINITSVIGKARIGYFADYWQAAGFGHVNQHTKTGYALLQANDGRTYLNATSNKAIHFRIHNQDKMIVNSNGRVGIGTTNPAVALDVHNGIDYASWGTWFDAQNTYRNGETIHGYSRRDQTRQVSIMGRGILSWAGFYAASDSRFKTNIQDINDSSALDLLRKIEPKKYEYIDTFEKGTGQVFGFIAQQIDEVFPNCVSVQKEKIPNIFERCIKVDNVITLIDTFTHTLEKDENGIVQPTLLVYHSDGRQIEITIKTILDDKHIEIEPTDELETSSELFIYGQVVDNFLTIDKNYIFTIATAALQEVDKQLQAEKAKTSDLEARMLLLEARLNKLDNNGCSI